jgi:hypothetical protein
MQHLRCFMEGHLGLRRPLEEEEEGQSIALVTRSEDLNKIKEASKSSGIGALKWWLTLDFGQRPR